MTSLAVLSGSLLFDVISGTESGEVAIIAAQQQDVPYTEREPVAPPRDNITVVTGQEFGDRTGDALIALAPDGRVLYYEDVHDEYQDVDPSPMRAKTVLFVASDHLSSNECDADVDCVRDIVERVNVSTGERDTVYTFTSPVRVSDKMHDIDYIGDHRLLVADISYDRIFIVNTTSEVIEWQWEMQSEYPFESGGAYPSDWTHMNGVEQFPDDRIMASPRNHDQAIFIHPEAGLQEDWTLGADDEYNVLYEQHQPDYIPESMGGPAVLVADSQNNRVVEYERRNGDWVKTWEWSDRRMQWPRDADRLPNGNTLIEDSNGGRIIEINPRGDIVWEIEVKSTYDVERLGTGDESSGGESASRLGLKSRSEFSTEGSNVERSDPVRDAFREVAPAKTWNAVRFITPQWVGIRQVLKTTLVVAFVGAWLSIKLYWRRDRLTIRSPLFIDREES